MMDGRIDRRGMMASIGAVGFAAVTAPLVYPMMPATIADAGSLGLRARADAKGLLCGSEVNSGRLDDPRLRAVLREDCNILVPDVELKWSRLQPIGNGPPLFGPAETIWDFAAANDMAMRGHTLTWYRAEPPWAAGLIAAMTPGQAGDFLQRYVTQVVGHWRGRVTQWDVANEPIDGSGKLTEPLFSARLGERYLDIAYAAAHAADPRALMVLNTDLIEQDGNYQERHRTQTLKLLERLLARGVPVQALGIEGHLSTLYRFDEGIWRRYLDEIVGLGLKIVVTEFDIADTGTLGSIAERDAATAAMTKAFLDVTLSYPACLGMLAWGQNDADSWLQQPSNKSRTDGAALRPSPRAADWSRKPMWHAIAAALDGAPSR